MKKVLFLSAMMAMSTACFPWGQKGHDVVCSIAQKHLTEKAAQQVSELLDGKSIVYWANWLDNASNTPQYAYSKTWHYKNINADETYDNANLNAKGDIVKALNAEIDTLSNTAYPRAKRQLALKMVIHLMGDLHQPMHMGHLSDLGGNKWQVNFFRNGTNLHSVWDSQLVESAHKWSHTEWTEELDRNSKSYNDSISNGTVEDWAKETFTITATVYEGAPQNANLSYDYVSHWTPTVEDQLLKAGLRLSKILNSSL